MFWYNDKIYFTRADLKRYLYQYFEQNPVKQWPTNLLVEYSDSYLYYTILKRYNKQNNDSKVMLWYGTSCTYKKGCPLEKTRPSHKYCGGYECNTLITVVDEFLASRASRRILKNRTGFSERRNLIFVHGLTNEIKTTLFQVIKEMARDSEFLITWFPTDVVKIDPMKNSLYNNRPWKLKKEEQ